MQEGFTFSASLEGGFGIDKRLRPMQKAYLFRV
jgi:hypothetical protein